jgi:hypothetical protein
LYCNTGNAARSWKKTPGELRPQADRDFARLKAGLAKRRGPDGFGEDMTREEIISGMREETMLGRLPTLAELGNVAAFMASDQASTMTATFANITCGAVLDQTGAQDKWTTGGSIFVMVCARAPRNCSIIPNIYLDPSNQQHGQHRPTEES